MKTTIKEFKQITENLDQPTQYLILVKYCDVKLVETSFSEGEGETIQDWDLKLDKSYKNVDDLIKDVSSNFFTEFNKEQALILDNRLILESVVDKETNTITREEVSLWENGEFDAYNLVVTCTIELYETKPVTDTERIASILDIENYD